MEKRCLLVGVALLLAACAEGMVFKPEPEKSVTTERSNPAVVQDSAPEPQPLTGLVWKTVNVRSGPGTEWPVIGKATTRSPVILLANDDNWYQVKRSAGQGSGTGWIRSDFIVVDSPKAAGRPLPLAATIVSKTALRSDPSASSAVLSRVNDRTPVTILGREANWYWISTRTGSTFIAGWVRSDFAAVDVSNGTKAAQPEDLSTSPRPGEGRNTPTLAPPARGPSAPEGPAEDQRAANSPIDPLESTPLGEFLAELAVGDRSTATRNDTKGRYSVATTSAPETPLREGGCTRNIGGTWASRSGRTMLQLNGVYRTGKLSSDHDRYRSTIPFSWETTPDTIRVAYTGPEQFFARETGKKMDFERVSQGGTVKCAFTGNRLTVGGVVYQRQ